MSPWGPRSAAEDHSGKERALCANSQRSKIPAHGKSCQAEAVVKKLSTMMLKVWSPSLGVSCDRAVLCQGSDSHVMNATSVIARYASDCKR